MKKYIILVSVLLLLGLTSCKDFLTVESDSKYGEEYVFGSKEEINRNLSAVYQSLMSSNSYGNNYLSNLVLNSDVEFSAYSSALRNANGTDYKCFDATRHGSHLQSLWTAVYQGIERANIFIYGVENSPIFSRDDATLMHQLGEARTLRAMLAHDLVVYFGDIPFATDPSYNMESLVMPVMDRNELLTFLITDLQEAVSGMMYARSHTDGVERASREFCHALIARMALTRGGYSLYPDKNNYMNVGTMERPTDYRDYYEIARIHADSVITSGTHTLNNSFRQVFINQCNYIVVNNDDPIFEIPFLKGSSGNVGYVHGPSGSTTDSETVAPNVWGGSNGGLRLNAFYRYSFDRSDLRLDYTVGMWYYTYDGIPSVRADYSTHCNKWSKFWATTGNAMGVTSSGSTGINFPYMRYADVLLMYAEAVNELESGVSGANGAKAVEALKTVRRRAFDSADHGDKVDNYVASVSGSKDDFFQAIVDERKWEFGGENIRWKDLVRWNLYAKVVYDCFMEYFIVGSLADGDYIDGYDDYTDLPTNMFYKRVDNPQNINIYPNLGNMQIIEFYNLYDAAVNPGGEWNNVAEFYNWGNEGSIYPANQCLYSFRGYIREGDESNLGTFDPNNLPPVRYILPYPNRALQLSNGAYTNYYGYN